MLDDSVECLSFCQVCDHMFDNCLGSEVIITIYFVVQQLRQVIPSIMIWSA